MPSTQSMTFNDYDGDSGVVGINLKEVTPATLLDTATNVGTLRASIEALILGVPIKSEMSIISRFNASNAKASDPNAQRGNKWRVSYRDTLDFLDAGSTVPNPGFQKTFDIELPTADLSLRTGNSEIVWTSGQVTPIAEFQTFVDEFEQVARSPYGGTPTVEFIEAVTRSGG